ncbi:hypothetical protein Esti_002583 [Eimeria stiedai]
MEVCEARGEPPPCLAGEAAASAASFAGHQQQQQQEAAVRGEYLQALKPLSLNEAQKEKEKRKLQDFKSYLVQTRVIQTLVQLLLEIKEKDPLPEEPQQVLIDYFGDYRDPVLDLIESLTEEKEKLAAENASMTQELESLGSLKESLQQENYRRKLWTAVAKSGASVTSLAFYQRLSDRKKPKGPLKNGMTAQILELLCPSGDPAESLPSANLRDDGENPILNAVCTAAAAAGLGAAAANSLCEGFVLPQLRRVG